MKKATMEGQNYQKRIVDGNRKQRKVANERERERFGSLNRPK